MECFYRRVEVNAPVSGRSTGGTGSTRWQRRAGRSAEARSIRYRAEDLAADVGISVPLLRSYQSKGLLPPPRHEGRVAWYGPHHRERLLHIRHLKDRGYSLRMIAEAVRDDRVDAPPRSMEEHEVLRLADVAERSGVPVAVLRALEASGPAPAPSPGGRRPLQRRRRALRPQRPGPAGGGPVPGGPHAHRPAPAGGVGRPGAGRHGRLVAAGRRPPAPAAPAGPGGGGPPYRPRRPRARRRSGPSPPSWASWSPTGWSAPSSTPPRPRSRPRAPRPSATPWPARSLPRSRREVTVIITASPGSGRARARRWGA